MSESKTFQDFIEDFNQLTPENRLKILTLLFELAGEEQCLQTKKN